MGFTLEKQMCLLALLVLLFPLLCTSQNSFTGSRATYYSTPDCTSQNSFTGSRATYYSTPDCYGNPSGACGFGHYGRIVYDGNVAGVSRLYRNGAGCGACYQVRCTNKHYCSNDGVNIVVTDYGEGDRTDFILSSRAFAKLAHPNLTLELFAYGVVNVEYRRISCHYNGYNLMVKVHENSRYPHYLAILLLYVGGQNDITSVELCQEDCEEWILMRRAYGTVWDMANPPVGSISLRLLLCGSAGLTWVQTNDVIPDYWVPGALYDSNIQLT